MDDCTHEMAAKAIEGRKLEAIHRRGKQLAFEFADAPVIVAHLGMSGQILVDFDRSELPSHVHALWEGSVPSHSFRVLFRDPRRFGGLRLLASMELVRERIWTGLGPDALEISLADFTERLKSTSRAIKAVLLDQAILAGVGNIYADEALFSARIHPSRPSGRLRPHEVACLAEAIVRVLRRAIASGGSTLRNYTDADGRPGDFTHVHRVYARAGLPCLDCGGILRGIRLAGRTTTFCPSCQHHSGRPRKIARP